MTRNDVLDQCYTAQTTAEITVARHTRSVYLHEHPEDEEVFDLGEMLTLLQEALQITGESSKTPLPLTGNAISPMPAAASS